MRGALQKISVRGFKSIRALDDFSLGNLNVIIGANGAGKSNFIQIFRMLMAMTRKNLSVFIRERGGLDSFLFNGPKLTPKIEMSFEFFSNSPYAVGSNAYRFELSPTVDERILISEWRKYAQSDWLSYGSPIEESRLFDMRDERSSSNLYNGIGYYVYDSISRWVVYHFHDTSALAPMRRSEIVEDSLNLRGDASNLAPLLLSLKGCSFGLENYHRIRDVVRLVLPFFDDFRLDVDRFGELEKVKLSWQQKGSDFPMQPYHLSDGSLRFICLATALLQPDLPSTIVIDEPELGLHPAAIAVLAELIQATARRTQVIVATQSPELINHFSVEDIIVMNRKDGASSFERLKEADLSLWLEKYSLGELWTKNLISAGPVYE